MSTKWSNTLKQFVGELFEFDHFTRLALKRLNNLTIQLLIYDLTIKKKNFSESTYPTKTLLKNGSYLNSNKAVGMDQKILENF